MNNLKLACAVAVIFAASMAPAANAAVVTSIPDGTVVPVPGVNYFGPGPQTLAPGITWSSTNAGNQGGSVYGFNEGYGFSSNGYWNSSIGNMIGLNDSTAAYGVTDTMTFTFSTPQMAVGGFMNYVPGGSTPTTIAVYTPGGTLIESYNLNFSTGDATNAGQFLGFQESTADIGYFTMTDNYIALVNFTVLGASSVPEPGSVTLLGLGLAGIAGLGWRKTRKQNASVV